LAISITAAQSKGARAMLGMSRNRLARAASITARTLADFERGARQPRASTLRLLQSALETAGIVFIDGDDTIGPGVQLRDPQRT
jgi:transcriptional regulator with XRE-family HTH domain